MNKYTILILIALLLSILNSGAQDASRLLIADTRNVDSPAAHYNRGIYGEFKNSNIVKAPVGGTTYGSLLTIAPWFDATGGKKHQLFFNVGGIFYRQGVHGQSSWEKWQKVLIEDTSGQVGIGTTLIPAGYKLAIAGKAIMEEVKVKLQSSGWPDYVFQPSYQLMPLNKVADYIKAHGHLPEVPSAKEVAENGIEVGANQAVLLKKIEELTLHLIELEKEIKGLKRENGEIKKRLVH